MPQGIATHFPFSAVVGCQPGALDDMGLALILTTIAPEIGGVLVRGEKGTAKSTTVRGLAAILPPIEAYATDRFSIDPDDATASSPDGPFGPEAERITRAVRLVELPVGATEDRVLGSLHLERALAHGKVEYEPGLLARAHRGILYVDEVNLLNDHLVDLLLDAAATGRATVERDSVSVEHAARFVLIGTMNPEEGELRPQLLDRFGLTVEVAAPRDPALRAEVVRRRMAYDSAPGDFAASYAVQEADLTARIEKARAAVEGVELSDAALLLIAKVCAGFEVDGLRADIVTARTAVAHAAWAGRSAVTKADIRRAAILALPHRRRRNPFDAPGLDEDLLDRLLAEDDLPEPPEPDGPGEADDSTTREDSGPSSSGESSADTPASESSERSETPDPTPSERSEDPQGSGPAPTDSTVAATQPYRPKLLRVDGLGEGADGRRSRAISRRGQVAGVAPQGVGTGLHMVATLQAAAGAQPARGRTDGPVILRAEDLRRAVRIGQEANLVLFCVDASGSMAARKRMSAVKTAILSLLLDAYRRRDKVGLVTFRGAGAEVVLPPTRSVDVAAARLDEIPAGGRTPLAAGLLEAARVIQRERLRDPRTRPLLVIVTDGRATDGADGVARSQQAADHLATLGITTVVVDSESGPLRFGLARQLAVRLGAEHLPVGEVSSTALTEAAAMGPIQNMRSA
ncbi:magnesium chelatase [Nocardioides baekrokdamisoli]|uniref:Mg-protoporphyrin IX chelatase n=1 Tax=Nocardioides baekrokdamisoli TaxID=1804624 RepID=A0A3G9IBI6_9ACTN|nr:magnesium chelatase subunit D family protein [Nocardioides baekrokdamisoli]BBH16210.1 magnesium chelatase [Nocardioides baekrokdamisoli]